MLYYFYGDSKISNKKAKDLVLKILDKKPDAEVFIIDNENISEDLIAKLTQSAGLFQKKYIVRIKQIDNKDQRELILKFLKEIKESENIFVWGDGEITKNDLKQIEKYAEKIVEINSKENKKNKFDNKIFEICTFLIKRDKKNSWTKYQELLEIYPVEEMHGTIFWQFKNMGIASVSNQKDSGLAAFPYQNAKKSLEYYSKQEILKKVLELSKMIHESRSGGVELEIALEKFILGL